MHICPKMHFWYPNMHFWVSKNTCWVPKMHFGYPKMHFWVPKMHFGYQKCIFGQICIRGFYFSHWRPILFFPLAANSIFPIGHLFYLELPATHSIWSCPVVREHGPQHNNILAILDLFCPFWVQLGYFFRILEAPGYLG